MRTPSPPLWRRLAGSLTYTGLVAIVATLAYLTFLKTWEKESYGNAPEAAGEDPVALIDLDSFVSRRERTADAQRLSVTLRLRLTKPGKVDCHVYLVARNDRVTPKRWAVWPPQEAGGVLTAGGHLRGGVPPTGVPLTLVPSWARINGSMEQPPGQPPYETVIVYVVGMDGQILLARPFAV
jgi:hypothetical protein